MLRLLLDEHGGKLPADVVPIFANTGEEAEGTLAFVHEMTERWHVPVRWIEFTREAIPGVSADLGHWREVSYCTASRNGEPFDALVDWKSYLPNATQRLCTEWLKVRAMLGFAHSIGFPTKRVRRPTKPAAEGEKQRLGEWEIVADFDQYLGIRADEQRRVAKQRAKENIELPLVDRGIVKGGVLDFWKAQPFDLQIAPGEGNCKLCHEKGVPQLRNVARSPVNGAALQRHVDREHRIGAVMKKGHPFAAIQQFTRLQLPMYDEPAGEDLDLRPCACGD